MKIEPKWVMWGGAAGLALLVLNRVTGGKLVTATASTIARAPVDAFYGATEGFLGLPDTRTASNVSKCDAARAAGDDWAASFYCPAATWFKGLFDGK